ncbi:MAG: hypothetical protein IIY81_11155 [Lachnospiraceae bacterium]|nr:hypothetical protein [Lachnospiraceae bacterium]
MFGTICCNKETLSEEQLMRYQSFYCGLCKTIRKKYGQMERIALNFDMTFLALILSSLYEPEEETYSNGCIFRTAKTKIAVKNPFIEYAADMTMLLAYFKCEDDWKDEKKYFARFGMKKLEKSYQKICEQYPRQSEKVEESLQKLHQVEQDFKANADMAIHFSGEMLSELFVYKEDYWSETLRNFGYDLGRFIYIMDAAFDYESDKKKGLYNPLNKLQVQGEQVEQILKIEMGRVVYCFDILPLVQDQEILKNVLFQGVWTKWNKRHKQETKKKE